MTDAERAAADDLLKRVDEAIEALKGETKGLINARNQYRRRQQGPDDSKPIASA